MCKVYTDYCGTSEIEHGLCACTVDNPLAKARGLSLRTGAQTMLYLSLVASILVTMGSMDRIHGRTTWQRGWGGGGGELQIIIRPRPSYPVSKPHYILKWVSRSIHYFSYFCSKEIKDVKYFSSENLHFYGNK